MSDPTPYELKFDIGTLKHLGLHMYSTLPPVLGELVSNAWDADATRVDITIPTTALDEESEIVVEDNGCGMSDQQVRRAYLIIGRDRRAEEGDDPTPKYGRKVMGRKGIGKFSAFGVAKEIELETAKEADEGVEVSRFIMDYGELEKQAKKRSVEMPSMAPTGEVKKGTRVTLRRISKYRTRRISITSLKRKLSRRYSILSDKFSIFINGEELKPEDQDLKKLLEKDADGEPYVWAYEDVEVRAGTGWKVSGWIGALDRTREIEDAVQRGISIMARGKMVQEPFLFEATVGQQFALSYLVGELHAEFVDETEDTVATARNSLVWDTEANRALKEWGQKEVNKVARQWAERRHEDNERAIKENPLYKKFVGEAEQIGNKRLKKVADRLIRKTIEDPLSDNEAQEAAVQLCLDYMHFDVFQELAEEIVDADLSDLGKLLGLFREWEFLEAKEMTRVTEGRIKTIERFQQLLDKNALEVPVLHNFLKEFPWVIDPKWTLVADEVHYSEMLREQFPEPEDKPDVDRRIDFLCVRESDVIVVVEIKRPQSKASLKELDQIEDYVSFMRDHVNRTTDPEMRSKDVVGYLLCGSTVDTYKVRGKVANLAEARIYVRKYGDLLRLVHGTHKEFLTRYDRLKEARVSAQLLDRSVSSDTGDGAMLLHEAQSAVSNAEVKSAKEQD